MSIPEVAARTLCAIATTTATLATATVAAAPELVTVGSGTSPRLQRPVALDGAQSPDPRAAGLLLMNPSERSLRVWSAIEAVATASGPSGALRSPTLRRLWEWARRSPHVIQVEMVEPSDVANGIAGLFTIERVDPAGRQHVALIRICPRNIRNGRVASSPNASLSFVRFEGLEDVADRYAEVLAHELAHAEHVLGSAERVARIAAAQRARQDFLDKGEHSLTRIPTELRDRVREAAAFLSTVEAHAETVEAAVLVELVGPRPAATVDCSRRCRN